MGLWRVSATEVKNSWGRVVRRVLKNREPALVESKGKPTVVILPADDYNRLITQHTAETHKQQQFMLLDEAERFAKKASARNSGETLPDSTEILRQMREERDEQLLGLR